jgi:hypothetical protein
VPGCTHSAFLDVHHVERRADGGDHHPDRLVPLCGAHHTAVHDATLVIRGSYAAGFRFEHADGHAYGASAASPARARTRAEVCQVLVAMGYKQREAQQMVDRAVAQTVAHVGRRADELDRDALLRAALRQATVPACVSLVREQRATYERILPRAA